MRKILTLVGTASTLTLFACGKTIDSTDLRTSGISAEMTAVAEGNGQTMVTVDLREGSTGDTHLDLKGSDELVAIASTGESQKMSKFKPDLANYYVYRAILSVETGGIAVAFHRGPDDKSAPNSQAVLPEPFILAGVVAGQTVSRSRGLTLTWAPVPGGNNMGFALSGCLSGSGAVPDAGTLTLDAARLVAPVLDEAPRGSTIDGAALDGGAARPDGGVVSCAAQICLERKGSGLVDPAFGDGGTFETIQRRCVAFNLVR